MHDSEGLHALFAVKDMRITTDTIVHDIERQHILGCRTSEIQEVLLCMTMNDIIVWVLGHQNYNKYSCA